MENQKVIFHINSLSKLAYKDKAVREAFLSEAVGKRVTLVPNPIKEDRFCVAVYYRCDYIAHVMRDETMLPNRALLCDPTQTIDGTIVAVEPGGYCLVVDCGELPVATEEEVERSRPKGMDSWTTSVAKIGMCMEMRQAGHLAKILMNKLQHRDKWDTEDIVATADKLGELLRYDLSSEMQRQRSVCRELLCKSDDEQLRAAGDRLMAATLRLGGEHQPMEVGKWMKEELARGSEADMMVAATLQQTGRRGRGAMRDEVVRQAEALPEGLYDLWQNDWAQFAKVLYGMRLTRDELLRVLSCLIWLDRTEEKMEEDSLSEDVCKTWKAWAEKTSKMSTDTIESGLLTLCRLNLDNNHAFDDIERKMFDVLEKKTGQQLTAHTIINTQPGSTANVGCEMKNPEFKILPIPQSVPSRPMSGRHVEGEAL